MSASFKRALNYRRAIKATVKRVCRQASQVDLNRSNAPADFGERSVLERNAELPSATVAVNGPPVVVVDRACADFSPSADFSFDGDRDDIDHDTGEDDVGFEEGNSACEADQASDNDADSDLASDDDGLPVFKTDAEKEQHVIDTVREWAQEPGVLSMTKLDHLLHRLSVVFPNMPLTYTTLFACDYDFQFSQFESGGEFWYKGIRSNLDQMSLSEYLLEYDKVTLDIGIDGMPLNTKTGVKVWPILGHLVGTVNAPFIIGAFKASHDPNDVKEFLADYVAELQDLQESGYTFQRKTYEFVIRFYILDAEGRQFIKCITSHCGYSGCEKCEVLGEHHRNGLTFLELDAQACSDESFRQRDQPTHHKRDSPLEDCGTGMVTQFPLDPMHLVYGGVVKRLLDFWLYENGVWKLHHEIIAIISEIFVFPRPYCPCDFNRKPQSLKYLKSIKCTELRRILLYDGILAFKDVVDSNIYKHFLLFYCSTYILASKSLFASYRDVAQQLLRTFITHSAVIYGKKFVVYNVHSLIHLVSDCESGGLTLDEFTAFKFENRLKSIKESLMSGLHPLHQLARRALVKKSY